MNAIEIAIRMEKDAIKFYTEAAEKTKHFVGKKMFLSITEDEKRHLEMLSQIFKEMNIKIQDVSPLNNIRTVFETMKDKMQERIEATNDELDVFKIAMQMEKEGIEFYKKAGSEARTEKERALFETMKDKMQEKIEATNDELDAFKIAMQMEKEGIEFYKRAVSEAKTEKERALFERLVIEEQQHYDIFANTYAFLTDTGNWFMWEEHSIVDGGTPWA